MDEKRRRKGEEGVALIVVLGFLSLMLVIAVAFLGTAQVERQVSDASLEAIRSRQLLRSALSAAMNDYSRELWGEKLYLPDEDYEVFVSEAGGLDAVPGSGRNLKGSQTQLLRGEALDWIPAKYMTQAVTNLVNDASWILVREDPGTRSRILGRYAYVCFDCSGALDANFVALEDDIGKNDSRAISNRTRRTIREMPMGLLPELADSGTFKSYRRGWKGFDSPQMLVKLTDGKAEDGSGSAARWQPDRKEIYGAGLTSNLVSELTSYSLSAYRGGRYNRGSATWEQPKYINPENGSGAWAALGGLQNQVNQGDIEHQVRDFTSSQVAPGGVTYPSVKNVPMFNEIIVRNMHFSATPTKIQIPGADARDGFEYSATVEVQFEFWYPFPGNKAGQSFQLKAPTLSMGSSPASAQIIMPVALVLNGGRVMLEGTTSVAEPSGGTLDVEAKYNAGKPYITQAFKYKVTFKTTEAMATEEPGVLWWRGWQTQGDIDLTYGGAPADRMPKGLGRSLSVMIPAGSDDPGEGVYSKEVCDPRLNHLASEWQDAREAGGTPGAVNGCTEANGDYKLEGAAMYCRNGEMETPADFGFFPTGKSWRTIDLLNENGAEFLALSTMDKNVRDALAKDGVFYTNAQLNVNTRCSNALASAFCDISMMEVPGWDAKDHEGIDDMEEEKAREVAKQILDATAKKPYQSGMDWAANAGLMGDNGYLAAQGYNRNQRESLLRNMYGLFSVADSLFTVVVVAQTVKEGPDKVGTWDSEDQVTGERRGVALVWRDPFKTGKNLHHEMMVKMFRYLND